MPIIDSMCGIVGYAGVRGGLTQAILRRMRDALTHRGPDGAGDARWRGDGRPANEGESAETGLAHRRLSIIDLSEAGAQPMANEDETLWITYNGEFYNFRDYRQELEEKGHRFKSHCDTETILHLYEEHGLAGTLERMNGMFAFGLWDSRRKELVLARDRLGKKPLYYAHLSDGSILFASEMKALLASGLVDTDQYDLTAMDQFWTFGFTIGSRTIYKQIRRLEAAQYLVWRNGEIEIRDYWTCAFGSNPLPEKKLDEWGDQLEELLCDAIRIRMVSDVPLGIFLSGGIDSSVITALAVRRLGRSVDTFTVSFHEDEFDEAPFALQIAEYLGVANTVMRVNEDLRRYFGPIARQFDEPFGDSSAIPTFFVAKSARQHVTVALTGDGGDEVFGGYDTYRESLGLWGTRQQRRQFRQKLTLSEWCWHAKLRWIGPRRGLDLLQSQTSSKHRRRLYAQFLSQSVNSSVSTKDRSKWYAHVAGADWLSQMQYLSLKTNTVDDILQKVDRMSMANGLECRSPLLDYRIVEFAARLPFSAKINEWGKGKAVLRRILSRYVPEKLFDRPKQGFCVPWDAWCQGEKGRELNARWRRMNTALFRPEAADMLFPADRKGSAFRQWQAFVLMEFLDSSEGNRAGHAIGMTT